MANIIERKSTSTVLSSELFDILSVDDKLEKTIDGIIMSLVSNLTETNRKVDSEVWNKLCCIMKVKTKFRQSKPCANKVLDCRQILKICLLSLETGTDVNISNVCSVLEQTLILMEADCFYTSVTNMIMKCQQNLTSFITSSDKSTCLYTSEVDLRILDTVLAVLLIKQETSDKLPSNGTELFGLTDDGMQSLVLELVMCNVKKISMLALLSVVPKLLLCTTTDNNLLQKIWRYVIANFGDTDIPHTFRILCTLASFYLPHDAQVTTFIVTQDENFWKIVQRGLTHTDSLVRKQALYLMKRAVDCSCEMESSILCPDIESSNRLFLILETLEEKQVHIVKPVLPIVDLLAVSNSAGSLHISWLLCAFQRIISHDNNYVIKWGLINFVRIYKEMSCARDAKEILEFLHLFINAINNSALYSPGPQQAEIREALKDLFESFIIESAPENCRTLFCHVLDVMKMISWAPVPLFNFIYALANTSNVPVWDRQRLTVLKGFVVLALGCQYVFIRGAIQCMLLDATVHLTDPEKLDLYTVSDYLASFWSSESLKRGTVAWNRTATWLKSFVGKDEVARYVSTSVLASQEKGETSVRSVARMVILLCDAELLSNDAREDSCSLSKLLNYMLSCFQDCDKRLYADEKVQNHSFEMIVYLLDESSIVCNLETKEDSVRNTILGCLNLMLDQVFICIKKRLFSLTHLRDYHLVNTYIAAIDTFVTNLNSLPSVAKHIGMLQITALEVTGKSSAPPLCHYFAMKLLSHISLCYRKHCRCTCTDTTLCTVMQRQGVLVEQIVGKGRLTMSPVKQEEELKLTRDLQTLWGKMTSGYLEACWCIVANFFHSCHRAEEKVLSMRSVEAIVSDALESLEIGGKSVLVPLMSVLEQILPKCLISKSAEATLKLIATCWTVTFELRKTELFWIAMKAFVQMLFQPAIMNAVTCQEHLLQYSQQIFSNGQAVTGLCNVLVMQLQNAVAQSSLVLESYVAILVDALTFGPVHRRDQRIISDTCRSIASLGESCSANVLLSNDCCADSEVRARAMQLVLSMEGSHLLAGRLVEALIQKDKDESEHKTRYYGDSHLHRLKHRVMQAILILEPLLNSEQSVLLLEWLEFNLLRESQQPSVRYQQEWQLVRILWHHPHLRNRVWLMFQQAREKRLGSICSFIAVVYHLACMLKADEQETFIDRSVQEILPWCMAQHFNIRLYAQTALQKLFLLCKQHQLNQLIERFSVIELCVQSSVHHGNAVRNAIKLQDDFYFSVFHPLEHYSLETIFHDLPRLANVTSEEWISVDVLRYCGVSATKHIDMESANSALKQCSAAAWTLRSSAGSEEEENTIMTTGLQSNVQKKLVPWRSMIPDDDQLRSKSVTKREGGLIVVASLVDRLPNLGGLSRTCEVFGVAEYVLASLRYTEDKEFRSLSVTAERWIPISEVKPHCLAQYLDTKKKEGYTVIGAEQTSNSVQLNDVRFPQKTLLLLGNEKEGIPANLLPLLDVCVEVPQQGMIRSLNVHVTGALFVWEYTKQHCYS